MTAHTGQVFTRRLRTMAIRDRPISPRSPWQNPYVERLIGTLRRECLDHVLIYGERHLRRILTLYSLYYNETRTHLGLGKDAPLRRHIERSGTIPIEKLLLFRPLLHKNNPEGRSCLRNAYRPYYFTKRLEEMEAILVERMSGFPVLYIPTELLDKANAPLAPGGTTPPQQAQAKAAIQSYKDIVTGVRVNQQMGVLLPSDLYKDGDGKNSAHRMYDFQLVTPQGGRARNDTDKMIGRHKVDTLMTLMCDFLMMGHEVRGTNNLAVTRVDMFYSAIEGWLTSISDVMNREAPSSALDHRNMCRIASDSAFLDRSASLRAQEEL
jgi:Integrase core domain